MATAPQWPRPASFNDEVNEPLVLVDRFKQHYLSICHHTADNPTATAPASYVMDVMFQANKVITLLANQMNLGAGKQHVEASTNTAQVVAQDASSVERETRAPEGGSLFGLEVADKTVGTIHDFNWGDGDFDGDQDWEDDGSSERDSEDEYYEYGDFEDDYYEYGDFEKEDEEKPNGAGGEQQAEPQVSLDHPVDAAAEATEETKNAVVSNINDAGWGDEDSEGDQDWEDNGSSEHDSEDDYYEYAVFGDDSDPEDEDQHEYQDGQPNGIDHRLENDTAAAGEHDQEETHPTPADPPGWRDVYDWIPGFMIEETVQDSGMPSQLPADPEAPHFKIRWGCVHPPYKGWRSRGMDHDDITNQVEDALAKSSMLELREVSLRSVQPYNLSGDLVVHPATREERACLLNHLEDWLPLLQQGHLARIPRVHYPEVQTKTENTVKAKPMPTPTIDTSPDLPGLRIRWRNNLAPFKAWNSRGLIYDDIWWHLYSALRNSDHPDLPGMHIPFMNINEPTGDIDIFLGSHTDRDFLYDTESSWVPLLEQGQHVRIMFLYDPEEQQPEPSTTTVHQYTETIIPSSIAATPTQPPPPLKIHWDTEPPYRGREDVEQTRQNLLCLLLEFFDPLPDAARKFNVAIDPETGDLDFYLDDDYKYIAMETIPQWLCLLERYEDARIPGIYNPLRRAKSRAKNAKKSRLSLVGGVQAEANGSEKDGSKDGSSSSQSRSERQLERRRTKRRQRRWERKLQRNAEVSAC